MELTQSWQEFIKTEIRKDISGRTLRGEILMAVACWDSDGFAHKNEAERAYQEHKIACQIRTYCRRNRISTRRGAKHAFDCRNEHRELWWMVRNGDMEGHIGNLRWWYRTVDGLKNLYLEF